MQRIKTGASLAGLLALYAFSVWQVWRGFTAHEVVARSGPVSFAESPALFCLIVFFAAMLVVAGPILAVFALTSRRIRLHRLRQLDQRRLLDNARRQTRTGEDA